MTPKERADRIYRKMCNVPAQDRWIMENFHGWMKEEFKDMQLDLDRANAEIERLRQGIMKFKVNFDQGFPNSIDAVIARDALFDLLDQEVRK